jgi:ADP-ribosylation factor-like protein 1
LGCALQHIALTPWDPLLLVCCQLAAASVAADLSPQDLPGALSDAEIAEAMGLHDIRNRDWAIFKTSAIKGDGLFEGLDWLANTLKTRGR